jgi:UrcA family protein
MAKLSFLLLAASVTTAGLSVPAAAEEDERPRAVVRYDDLNLASVAGRERLSTRVRTAVKRMCRTDFRQTLQQRAGARMCKVHAMRSVEPQLAALLNGNGTAFAGKDGAVVTAR